MVQLQINLSFPTFNEKDKIVQQVIGSHAEWIYGRALDNPLGKRACGSL